MTEHESYYKHCTYQTVAIVVGISAVVGTCVTGEIKKEQARQEGFTACIRQGHPVAECRTRDDE